MSDDTKHAEFRPVAEHGREVIRASMLMNGGASIALLAFIGNIWSTETDPKIIQFLFLAMANFSGGLLLAGVWLLQSYHWHYSIFNISTIISDGRAEIREIGMGHGIEDEILRYERKLDNKLRKSNENLNRAYKALLFISLFPYGAFCAGIVIAVIGLWTHF